MAFNCYFSCSLQRRWNVETKRPCQGKFRQLWWVRNTSRTMTPLRGNYDNKRWLRNRHKTVLIDFHHLQRIQADEIVFYKNENENSDPFRSERRGTLFSQATDEVILFENLYSLLCCLTSLLIFHMMSSFLVTRSTCMSDRLIYHN